MRSQDTTVFDVYTSKDSLESENRDIYKVEVISKGKEDSGLLAAPIFKEFIFPVAIPIIVTLVTFFITRYITRKKDRAEIRKIETDTDKNKAEIEQIRSSFQPVIVSSLQTIQNQIFQNKTDCLKHLIHSKNTLFEVEQVYNEGEAFVQDEYDYYQNVYWQISDLRLKSIKDNILKNGSFFPNSIRISSKFYYKILIT